MITKRESFDEIYFINSPERLTNTQWDNLLLVGKKNWDTYFLPFKTKREHEVIKGVELLCFDSEKSMFGYIKKLNPRLLLNFSLEHDMPSVLKLV